MGKNTSGPRSSSATASTASDADQIMRPVTVIRRPPTPHYEVTGDMLDIMRSQKRDVITEFAFLAVGGVIGSATSVVTALHKAYSPEIDQPLPLPDIVTLALFVAFLAIAVVCGLVAFTRGKNQSDIFEEIQNPKRV